MLSRSGLRSLLPILLTILVAACGGGDSSGRTVSPPALSVSYSPLQPYYYANVPITPLTPTVTGGKVTTWQLGTQLPSGLTFNTANGVISGTPTAASPETSYGVIASNSSGSTNVVLTFGVDATAPAFFYGSCPPMSDLTTIQFTVGIPSINVTDAYMTDDNVAIGPLTPFTQAGCSSGEELPAYQYGVEPWSISPALPAGLTFSNSTGAISGTPTALSASVNYVVTGGGPGGQMSAPLSIGVSNFALDLGHAWPVQAIQFDASHVVSQDISGLWTLWNYATGTPIASGQVDALVEGYLPFAVAGDEIVIGTSTGFELRSTATGELLAAIPVVWWQLASDNSYICGGTNANLSCWSLTGKLLFSKSGDYSNALAQASPDEVLIGRGAVGQNVIETISTATWTSSVGPAFQGGFYAWFLDGARFLTTVNYANSSNINTVYVYSSAGVLEDQKSFPSEYLGKLFGQGNWFWTDDANGSEAGTLYIYAVGHSAQPAATFSFGIPAVTGAYITWISGSGSGALKVIDLSGAAPVETSYTVPLPSSPSSYAWYSPSQFMLGTEGGFLVDASNPSNLRTLGYGAVTNIAGSTARAVFTTASANTFSYESATNTLQKTIDLSASQQIVLSSDGSILATLDSGPGAGNVTVNIYAMPAGTLINSFPYSTAGTYPLSITLSGGGTVLGENLSNGNCGGYEGYSTPCVPQTVPVTGGAVTTYPSGYDIALQLSPDGTLAAVTQIPALTTSIYQNGTLLAAALPGYAAAWLDNGRLLVTSAGSAVNIYSPTGVLLGTTSIPPNPPLSTVRGPAGPAPVQVVSPNLVFVPWINEVLSLASGNSAWASGDLCGTPTNAYLIVHFCTFTSAFAGSAVVFNSENQILVQPY
jgi:Putative Ig domain